MERLLDALPWIAVGCFVAGAVIWIVACLDGTFGDDEEEWLP